MASQSTITEFVEAPDHGPKPELIASHEVIEVRENGKLLAAITRIEGGINIEGNAIASLTLHECSGHPRSLDIHFDERMQTPPFRCVFARVNLMDVLERMMTSERDDTPAA